MRIPFPVVARTGKKCGPAAPAAMQKFFNRVTLDTRDRHLTKNKFIAVFSCGIACKIPSSAATELATAKLSVT
jgi:hypothetical protein